MKNADHSYLEKIDHDYLKKAIEIAGPLVSSVEDPFSIDIFKVPYKDILAYVIPRRSRYEKDGIPPVDRWMESKNNKVVVVKDNTILEFDRVSANDCFLNILPDALGLDDALNYRLIKDNQSYTVIFAGEFSVEDFHTPHLYRLPNISSFGKHKELTGFVLTQIKQNPDLSPLLQEVSGKMDLITGYAKLAAKDFTETGATNAPSEEELSDPATALRFAIAYSIMGYDEEHPKELNKMLRHIGSFEDILESNKDKIFNNLPLVYHKAHGDWVNLDQIDEEWSFARPVHPPNTQADNSK